MKAIILITFLNTFSFAETLTVKVVSTNCSENIPGQFFIASENEPNKLIYQIELPIDGSLKLNLPKEKYRLSFITKSGCDSTANINLEKDMLVQMKVSKNP